MAIQLNTNPVFLDPELAEILEYQRNSNIGGGTNLAGQGGGGLLNRLRNQVQETDPYAYGSYVIPASDPTYSSGFNYARTIAGGMPFEDVVAPGMSFSPEEPMGYTQADLRKKEIYGDFDGVMPAAPTQGTPYAPNEGFVQMPSAPQGVSGPTRILPEQTPFMGIPDYLRDLDFSNLPRFEDIQDIRGVENIRPSLFDVDVEEILKDIDTEKFADIDFGNIDIPPVVPTMPTAPAIQQPITPIVQEPTIPQVPVMPQVPAFEEPISFIPKLQNIPMNFTGLPQMPVIPNIPVMPKAPVMPQPIVPQPIPPMNFTGLSNLPVSNFVQPNIDEIVRPISRQGKFLTQQPGLFNLA